MQNKHLEQFGAIGDALHNLWDAAETQYVMAQEQQQAAKAAIESVTEATEALNRASRSLKGQLAEELRRSMDGAAEGAAGLLAAKFTEANKQADQAAATYKSAASWTTFKVFALTTAVGALIVGAGVFVLLRSIPSYGEIKALQENRAQLSSTITTLEKRGGRAVLAPCRTPDNVERMCARVYEYQTGQRYLAVIDGY